MARGLDNPGLPGQEPPVTNWLVALSHDSPLEQPALAPGRTKPPPPLAAVPSLLSLLKDTEPNVRLRAAMAVGDLARELRRALPALRTALEDAAVHDGDQGVRTEAMRAFLCAGPQPATDLGALIDALHSGIDVVRFHASVGLGDLGPAAVAAIPDLIHASSWDEEPAARVASAIALWKIDDRKIALVLKVLTEALDDGNEMTCWVAAESLARLGPVAHEAVPALKRALLRSFRLSIVAVSVKLALERIDPSLPGEGAEAATNGGRPKS
jgi:HEAT repeat protein